MTISHKNNLYIYSIVTLSLFLAAGAWYAFAVFQEPAFGPPAGNVNAPLTTGIEDQEAKRISFPGISVGAQNFPEPEPVMIFENGMLLSAKNSALPAEVEQVLLPRDINDNSAIFFKKDSKFVLLNFNPDGSNDRLVEIDSFGYVTAKNAFCAGLDTSEFCNQTLQGPWATLGNDTYTLISGNTGIGTPTPQAKLDIQTTGPRWTEVISWGANTGSGTYFGIGQNKDGIHILRSGCPDNSCPVVFNASLDITAGDYLSIAGSLNIVSGPLNVNGGRPVLAVTLKGRAGGTWYDTGVPYDTYFCFIGGAVFTDGDINENDTGDIMVLSCRQGMWQRGNSPLNWECGGDFRSHNKSEEVGIHAICIHRGFVNVSANPIF